MLLPSLDALHIKVFADGAELRGIAEMRMNPLIQGFTTNPTLMRKGGVEDYERFARDVLDLVTDRPVSFEVFSDSFAEMEMQALEIASWGQNVNVKIPVTNTRREFAGPLLARLARAGVSLNVTAVMTLGQVDAIVDALGDTATPVFVSVFAGRIADTGRDPIPLMSAALQHVNRRPGTQLIWASPREVLNLFQADSIGCHVITMTNDLLKKLTMTGKNLAEFSLETVQMFRDDAVKAGYHIAASPHPAGAIRVQKSKS